MKNVFRCIAIILLSVSLVGCSSGVSQEDYDKLKEEYDTTANKLEKLQNEYDKLNYDYGLLKEKETLGEDTTVIESTPEVSYSIDWNKLDKEIREELTNPEYFSYVKDTTVLFNAEESKIVLTAALNDLTSKDVILDFADTFIRQVNLAASMQDSTIATGTESSYGGLYDKYTVMIGIAPISEIDDQNKWFIYDSIYVGTQNAHKFKLQKAYR